ncbi:hypothetical protein [Mycobacterium sp. MUNTM1]
MASHACERCGYEPRRPKRDAWADRHPAAAVCTGVFVGLPALYTVAGVILAYPWFFMPMLVVVCMVVVDRRMRRRAAIAARADYEYRQQMLGAVTAERGLSPGRPMPAPADRPGHVMNRWPTTPARRPADHWSKTEPIRRSA